MNMNRGVFENFANQAADPKDSPFAIAEAAAAGNPFTAVVEQDSPFTIADEKKDEFKAQSGTGSHPLDSPFQVAEPSEGYGFEGPAKMSPFEAVSASSTLARSPLAGAETSEVATADLGGRPEPTVSEPAEEAGAVSPVESAAESDPFGDPNSDSYSIRQLELRAIFGVDREMTPDEILQRSRALPGIRAIARVSPQDMSTIEGIKNLVPNLGFGGGALKLYLGSVPLEFIREGKELLAVQTEGGFAPGVRETLILVARELGRSA